MGLPADMVQAKAPTKSAPLSRNAAIVLAVLVLHWTQTRTEPAFLTPFIDHLAPFFPSAPGPVGPPPKVYP